MSAQINPTLLLKAIHYAETEKLKVGGLCARLDINPTTFLRQRCSWAEFLGVHLATARDVGIVYVKAWGILDPNVTRTTAAKLVRMEKPGGHRRAMIERKPTPDTIE